MDLKDLERFRISGNLKIIQPEIFYVKKTDSTNSQLLERMFTANGTVLWADYQTAGRGRFDRKWESPAGQALLFSVLLTDIKLISRGPVYTFLAAMAVYAGLKKFVSGDHHLSLKWPNDVLLDGKKIGGILIQGKMSGAVQERLVVGIGININQPQDFFEDDIANGSSLFATIGKRFNRQAILVSILQQLDKELILLQDKGESLIFNKWRDGCDSIGSRVIMDNGQQVFEGIFTDIDDNGAMILDTGVGIHLFHAGDVTILKRN